MVNTFNNNILILGLITSIFSLIISLNLTPIIKKFASKNNFFDIPDHRKQKNFKLVRIGGLGILISYFLAILLFVILNYIFKITVFNDRYLLIFLISSFSFFIIGFIDDFKNLSPISRLITQFTFAFIVWINSIKIENINFPFLNNEFQIPISDNLSIFLTTFWIVGIINAINWIDGIDGLAIGISIITNFSFMIFSLSQGEHTLFLLLCAIIGSSLGFLRFNQAPSKILMGDGGSYLLGINSALFSLTIFNSSNQSITSNFSTDLFTPSLILCIPVLDSIRVCISRLLKGVSPFFPDRSHIHHKLMNLKISEKKTLNILYLLNLLVCILALIINKIEFNLILFMNFSIFALWQIIKFKK